MTAEVTSPGDLADVRRVLLGGLPIAVINRAESATLMADLALARRRSGVAPLVITSANGQVISMCARHEAVRAAFLSTDLVHADGMSIVFASRLPGRVYLPERVATTDLFHDVARVAEVRGLRFYLFGATPEVIAAAEKNVRRLYPKLALVGCRNGYYDRADEPQIVRQINSASPDILWVGLGVPLEQMFSVRNRGRLTNVGLIKTSGGLFNFLAGRRRAPVWMQCIGLEWLHRLGLEPMRLGYRYLITNPHAAYLLVKPIRKTALSEGKPG